MFKKFLNNKGKEWFGTEKTPTKNSSEQENKADQSPSSAPSCTIDQKPFKVNLNEIWQYDHEELSEFVHQYEEYIVFLREKCHESFKKNKKLEEDLEALRHEKAHTKQQNTGELTEILTPTNNSLASTKDRSSMELEWKQVEEFITQKINLSYVDEGLLKGLQDTCLGLVEQLSELRNSLADLTAQGEGQVGIIVKESFKDELANVIGDVEMTSQLVFPKLLNINDKIKAQEKLLIKEVLETVKNTTTIKYKGENQNESPPSPDNGGNRFTESEVGELRLQLEEARTKLAEFENNKVVVSVQPIIATKNEEGKGEDSQQEEQVSGLSIRMGELEHKIKEGEGSLAKAEGKIRELEKVAKQAEDKLKKTEEEKVKQLETAKQEYEKGLMEAQNTVKETERKVQASEAKLKESQGKARQFEAQRDEAKDQMEWLKKEYQKLINTNEKAEEETEGEVTKLQEKIAEMEKEIAKLQEKAMEVEQSKTDLENKLIQERLRHHQTSEDMQKVNQTLKQAEENLNAEIDAHKGVVVKNEGLKKKILENEKKMLEYKKMIKKLSQQILELHNKINEEAKKSPEKQQPQEIERDVVVVADSKEFVEDQILEEGGGHHSNNNGEDASPSESSFSKIREIQNKLEEALKEIVALKNLNTELTEEKKAMSGQIKILQEKREIGLQEINKLNKAIDTIKAQNPSLNIPVIQPIIPLTDKSLGSPFSGKSNIDKEGGTPTQKPQHHHSKSIAVGGGQPQSPTLPGKSHLNAMKRNLDNLYKEVIMALTNPAIKEGKSGENDENEQSLVRLEKKINDTMLLLNDYMEIISKL